MAPYLLIPNHKITRTGVLLYSMLPTIVGLYNITNDCSNSAITISCRVTAAIISLIPGMHCPCAMHTYSMFCKNTCAHVLKCVVLNNQRLVDVNMH